MYLRSLTLQNFVCFEETEVSFRIPGEDPADPLCNFTLLLGDNGAGKTALLRAITILGLGDLLDQSGFVPRHLVRFQQSQPSFLKAIFQSHLIQEKIKIESEIINEKFIKKIITHNIYIEKIAIEKSEKDSISKYPNPEKIKKGEIGKMIHQKIKKMETYNKHKEKEIENFPLYKNVFVSYGATRRTDSSDVFDPQQLLKQRTIAYQRVAGIFEEYIALTPLRAWLLRPDIAPARVQEVREVLNLLLPDKLTLDPPQNYEILFDLQGLKLPFSALSDGYRGYVGMVGDLLYHLHTIDPEKPLREAEGIVLIDEIDLHLHPRWQLEVVERLATTFPNIQFFATSHSPLVAGTLRPENIVTLEMVTSPTTGLPTVEARRFKERIHGLTADQILASAYFGLHSTRAPESHQQRRALAEAALEGDQDAALKFLQTLTEGIKGT